MYLFHQCATSVLSRDGRIADCTVRHPGVEPPFSSLSGGLFLKDIGNIFRANIDLPKSERVVAISFVLFTTNHSIRFVSEGIS